jgi:hypothetical protein
LSRNIKIVGDAASEAQKYGGHITSMNSHHRQLQPLRHRPSQQQRLIDNNVCYKHIVPSDAEGDPATNGPNALWISNGDNTLAELNTTDANSWFKDGSLFHLKFKGASGSAKNRFLNSPTRF